MAKKPTIAETFTEIEEYLRNEGMSEWADFIAERREMAGRKSANRKPTERQLENAQLGEQIVEYLRSENGVYHTITEITNAIDALHGLNNQRVSAIVRGMPEISKQVVNSTSYFGVKVA